MRRYLLTHDYYKKSPLRFEFLTTGQFSPKALDYLKQRKHVTTKYEIEWKDGPAIRQYVRSLKESYIATLG